MSTRRLLLGRAWKHLADHCPHYNVRADNNGCQICETRRRCLYALRSRSVDSWLALDAVKRSLVLASQRSDECARCREIVELGRRVAA